MSKLTVRELLDQLTEKPESQCYVQLLRPAITNISRSKGKATKVTFVTNQMDPADAITGKGKFGFVVWVDASRL